MEKIRENNIKFVGLGNGHHVFDFEVQKSFFALMGNGEIRSAHLHVQVEMDKKERMLDLDFHINGTVEMLCDRCTGPMDLPVDAKERLIVKLEEDAGEQDEILYLPPQEYELKLNPYIYEFTLLSLPLRKVHPESECDPEILKYLEKDSKQEEQHKQVDPRWNALKNLPN